MPLSLHIMHITRDAILTAHHAHHMRDPHIEIPLLSHTLSTAITRDTALTHTRCHSHCMSQDIPLSQLTAAHHEMPLSLIRDATHGSTSWCACTSHSTGLWCTNRSQGHDRKVRFAQEHKSTQVLTQPCFARWALCWPWPSTPCMCMLTGLHGHTARATNTSRTTRSVPGSTASHTSSYVQMQAHLSVWFCADSPGSVAGRMQMSASKRNVTSANAARVARSILRGSTTARGRPEVSAIAVLVHHDLLCNWSPSTEEECCVAESCSTRSMLARLDRTDVCLLCPSLS
jgi:hypothetical protein